MPSVFTKTSTVDNLVNEAAALNWLAEASEKGGANVAKVVHAQASKLELEFVNQGSGSRQAAREFGKRLAKTHAHGADYWGCPPPNWHGPLEMGPSRTPLVSKDAERPKSWGTFYATYRIENFANRLWDKGSLSISEKNTFAKLCARLRRGDYDTSQPHLVKEAGHEVARVHGDLWAGNVLYDDTEGGATLIDPMAHGGHAETDLGTLSSFGFLHLDDVYAGYNEASPLAEGWQSRVHLHELGIIIMHADLFGGGYKSQALRLAERYV